MTKCITNLVSSFEYYLRPKYVGPVVVDGDELAFVPPPRQTLQLLVGHESLDGGAGAGSVPQDDQASRVPDQQQVRVGGVQQQAFHSPRVHFEVVGSTLNHNVLRKKNTLGSLYKPSKNIFSKDVAFWPW